MVDFESTELGISCEGLEKPQVNSLSCFFFPTFTPSLPCKCERHIELWIPTSTEIHRRFLLTKACQYPTPTKDFVLCGLHLTIWDCASGIIFALFPLETPTQWPSATSSMKHVSDCCETVFSQSLGFGLAALASPGSLLGMQIHSSTCSSGNSTQEDQESMFKRHFRWSENHCLGPQFKPLNVTHKAAVDLALSYPSTPSWRCSPPPWPSSKWLLFESWKGPWASHPELF